MPKSSARKKLQNLDKLIEEILQDGGDPRGTTVTLYSASGGLGCSSTAHNLALWIAMIIQTRFEMHEKPARQPRILLLDGNLAGGSLALSREGQFEPHSLQLLEKMQPGWPENFQDLQANTIQSSQVSRLDILPASIHPEDLSLWSLGDCQNLLGLLQKHYDWIIIDGGGDFMRQDTQTWLQQSDWILWLLAGDLDVLVRNSVHYYSLRRKEAAVILLALQDHRETIDLDRSLPELFPGVQGVLSLPRSEDAVFEANHHKPQTCFRDPRYTRAIEDTVQAITRK